MNKIVCKTELNRKKELTRKCNTVNGVEFEIVYSPPKNLGAFHNFKKNVFRKGLVCVYVMTSI